MNSIKPKTRRARGISTFLFLACGTLVIGILYFGREVLIPIALAILLTFILSPVVNCLRRWGLGHVLSVILTVVLAFAVLSTIGTIIVVELKSLANELPAYRENIREKISDIRSASKSESLTKVKDIAKEIVDELKQNDAPSGIQNTNLAGGATNAPVVVQEKTTVAQEDPILDSLLEQLGSAGLVVVLVVFMLLRREDLRDRLLHLAGRNRLVDTTKAIEEVSQKVSRYLVRQCMLNAIFGVGIAAGLSLIGLPYAMLWGFLAGIARFIPYAGPIMGAIAPTLMSLAVFNSWALPLIVISLILGWELINNMVLEPVIYGQGIGVSEVALLVMMAFWTWLWGPLGLVLAAPLTVCFVVICKSVPELKFIALMLDSKAALTPHQALYQRLVAQNHDEAYALVKDYLKTHSRTELFESLLLAVLSDCRYDRINGKLSIQAQKKAFEMLRLLLEENRIKATDQDRPLNTAATHPSVVGCPSTDATDEMALLLLADLLKADGIFMPVLSADLDDRQKMAEIAALKPTVVCFGRLADDETFPAGSFFPQLRQHSPQMPLVVGSWGAVTPPKGLPEPDSVTLISHSFSETRTQLLSLCGAPPVREPLQAPEPIVLAPAS
ncbi:MAG: tqsA 1 [Verrucomicrobia bacterium]|jgi:predicted PurR-regulated permease PerM|nr:tqsA 1 [Verrucomicrobiota bacterium]